MENRIEAHIKLLNIKLNTVERKCLEEVIKDWRLLYGMTDETKAMTRLNVLSEKTIETVMLQTKTIVIKAEQKLRELRDELVQMEKLFNEWISLCLSSLPLLSQIQKIEECLVEYRRKVYQQKAEFKSLCLIELSLCEDLGLRPADVKESEALPSARDIKRLQQNIAYNLEVKKSRLFRILELEVEISNVESSLGIETDSTINLAPLKPTRDNLNELEETLRGLKRQELKRKIDKNYALLRDLWDILDLPYKLECGPVLYNEKELNIILREKTLWEDVKRARMQSMSKMRSEILELMHNCRKPPKAIENFISSPLYVKLDESSLEHQEMELKKLKSFYDENFEIFNQLNCRDGLQLELSEVVKHNKKHRFENRTATLLKEEQLKKELMKVEIALSKSLNRYEAKRSSPFMVFGKPLKVNAFDNSFKPKIRKAFDILN